MDWLLNHCISIIVSGIFPACRCQDQTGPIGYRLTNAQGKPRLARSNRGATAAKIADKVTATSDRKVSEHDYNTVCFKLCSCRPVWVPQGADPFSLLKAPIMDTWASELDQGAMKEGGQLWWIMLYFTCASLSWEKHDSWMLCGKPQVLPLMQMLLRPTCLNTVAYQVHPSYKTVFPEGSGLLQQDNPPCHTS